MTERAYIICATPRSGSGLLSRGLAATGVLGSPDEYFSRGAVHRWLGEWGLRDKLSSRSAPKAVPGTEYGKHVRSVATRGGVLGIVVHWYQLEWTRDAELVTDILDVFPDGSRSSVKVIRLTRSDRLGQAISTLIADSTRQYYHEPGKLPAVSEGYEEAVRRPPQYDPVRIREHLDEIKRQEHAWDLWLAERAVATLHINYSDLCDSYEESMRRVIDFLGGGAELSMPEPQLLRQHTFLNDQFRELYLRDRRSES